MTTLSRYVLKEHGWPFALGFALILFILLIDVVLQTMDQGAEQGADPAVPPSSFCSSTWLGSLALAVPHGRAHRRAHGLCPPRGRRGKSSRPKPAGVSFWLLLRPVLAAAFLLTLLMILFNDQILPDWNQPSSRLVVELAADEGRLGAAGKGRGLHSQLGRLSPAHPQNRPGE